jgi:hypothetical protein
MYNCSDKSFYNGVSCLLDCDLYFPLNGTNLITCERDGNTDKGKWSWGSEHQPFCEGILLILLGLGKQAENSAKRSIKAMLMFRNLFNIVPRHC